jgi:hypothetical protein
MTYEFKAVRIDDSGRREDCIVSVKYDEHSGIRAFSSRTMRECVDQAIIRYRDVTVGWKVGRTEDHDGQPSLFFRIIYGKGQDKRENFFKRFHELEQEIRYIAWEFEPDLFAYVNLEEKIL